MKTKSMRSEDANAPEESQQKQPIKPEIQKLQLTEDQSLQSNEWFECLRSRTRTILNPEIFESKTRKNF
jgi:hypothetical protein